MLEPGSAAVFSSQLESHFALNYCHWEYPKAEKSLKRSSCSSLGFFLWDHCGTPGWVRQGSETDWCFPQALSDLPAERDLWVEQWCCKRIPRQSGWIWLLELALRSQTYQGSVPECPEPVELTYTKYVAGQSLCINFGSFCKVSPVNYLTVEYVKNKIGRVFFFLLSWTRNSPYGFWGLDTRTVLIMWCHISWNPQTVRLLGFPTLAFLLVCHNSSTIQTGISCMFGLRVTPVTKLVKHDSLWKIVCNVPSAFPPG